MRGLPWLRLLLIVAVFAVMGVPVWRLTRPVAAAVAPAAVTSDSPVAAGGPFEIEVTFVGPPPTHFQLKQAGQTVLQGDGPGTNFRGQWTASLPKEGTDLTFEAQWPPDAPPAAARVSVSFPSGESVVKVFWARPSLVEIVTLPGSGSAEEPPSS